MYADASTNFTAWIADLPLRTKGLLVLAMPLTTLIVAMGLFYVNQRQQESARTWVMHTFEVRTQLQAIYTTLLNAEAGVRGYSMSGDTSFLNPYQYARQILPRQLTRLRLLIADNQVQAPRADRLKTLGMERLNALGDLRDVAASSGSMDNLRPVISRGRRVMDTVRELLDSMQSEEDRLLETRTARSESISREAYRGILVSVICGLGSGILAMLLLTSGIVRRAQNLEENAGRLARELPLLPLSQGSDELGRVEQALETASALLAERSRSLRESQGRLEGLFLNTQDAILLMDEELRCIDANPAAITLLGYDRDDLLKLSFSELAQVSGRESSPDEEDSSPIRKHSGEYTLARKDGTLIDVEYRSASHIVPGVHLMVMRDITDRKQTDQALKQAKEDAESANRSKSEFLSRMSHELRTPLNAILGFGQLLDMDELQPQQQEGVDHILKAGNHLLALVNDVLDISRIETGRLSFSTEPVQVSEILEATINLVRSQAVVRNVRLRDPEPCGLHVLADRQRLMQILLNLFSNAIKYNSKGGTVTILCEETLTGRVRISVNDTGDGIPPEKLDRVFTPFDRLGAERSGIEGAGIGLALSKRLVDAMGGTIGVESVVHEGSAFWVELPQTENPLEQLHGKEVSGGSTATHETRTPTAPRSILYIEDNLANLDLVEGILALRPEVQLLAAMQGRRGLELAREHSPDVILLDLHLPDIGGDEVLRQLQEDPVTGTIPIIMISADATPGQIQRLLAAGAADYLTKPLNVKQFLEVVDRRLKRYA